MRGIDKCCRDCEERYPACHDYCERYQAALDDWNKRKEMKKKADEFYIYKIEKMRKDKKRRSDYEV